MLPEPTPTVPTVIDERFMDEWLAFGWSELVAYLTKWARFLEFYPEQEDSE